MANFLAYVEAQYDGETFYRAMPYGDGADPGGIRSDGASCASRSRTSGREDRAEACRGALSMANAGPDRAVGFLRPDTDIPALDADFAAFGRVFEGMEVVKKILAAPVSPTKGEGNMKGQILEPG